MKLLHIADLHIGKRLNEFNLIDDQRYILEQILAITKDENPDGSPVGMSMIRVNPLLRQWSCLLV